MSTSWRKRETTPSESESEERQNVTPEESRRVIASKIRNAALNLLHSVISTSKSPKTFHPYFNLFFPFYPNSAYYSLSTSNNNLFSLISSDSSSLVRLNAVKLAKLLLEGSESYLKIAEDPSLQVSTSNLSIQGQGRGRGRGRGNLRSQTGRPSSSFISLSERLGGMVRELHSRMYGLLLKPYCSNYPSNLLTSILFLASTIVDNSPYDKLHPSLLQNLLRNVLTFLEPLDAREVCAAAVAVTMRILEVCRKYECESTVLVGDLGKDGITKKVLSRLQSEKADGENAEILWSLLLLSVTASDLKSVIQIVKHSLAQSKTETKLLQLKCLAAILPPSAAGDHMEKAFEEDLRTIQHLLDSSNEPAVKSASCSFLLAWNKSTEQTFQKLKVLTLDEDVDVKISAIRSIGFLFDKMHSIIDQQELVDFLLMLLNDPFAPEQTRYPLTWALANIADSDPPVMFSDSLTHALIESLISVFHKTSSANVQGNIVRSLGCIFALGDSFLPSNDIINSIEVLQTALKSEVAKLRWNTAHALYKIFSAKRVAIPVEVSQGIRDQLIEIVRDDRIYKARIQAVSALGASLDGYDSSDGNGRREQVMERLTTTATQLRDDLEAGKIPSKEASHASDLLKKISSLLSQPEVEPEAG
ncbi:ARM repeat-containing protein [Atractiella rhizophila]|nr:ARM repeat-containing protein [Atractiella rhizophila]